MPTFSDQQKLLAKMNTLSIPEKCGPYAPCKQAHETHPAPLPGLLNIQKGDAGSNSKTPSLHKPTILTHAHL